MKENKLTLSKLAVYTAGIIVFTSGIAMTIQSKLGTSPFDALLVGLYRSVGLTIGSWEIIVGGIMVIINAVSQRSRPEYLAMLTAIITGICIDFWVWTYSGWLEPQLAWQQYGCLIFGMVLVGFGVALYLTADFAIIPFDRMMLVVSALTGWSVAVSRAMLGILLVCIALFFNGAIGIGTLLIALFGGVFISLFRPFIKNFIHFP